MSKENTTTAVDSSSSRRRSSASISAVPSPNTESSRSMRRMSIEGNEETATTQASTTNRLIAWRPIVLLVWTLHFAVSIVVMVWGRYRYADDHKYVSVDPTLVGDDCVKAYANVFASSADDNGALVCCRADTADNTDGTCESTPPVLGLSRRINRLTESILLPLFPVLVRAVVQLVQWARRRGQDAKSNDAGASMNALDTFALRRLALYVGLILIRMFVLYLGFEAAEDQLVEQPEGECWYDEFSKPNDGPCEGKTTDFSDHIVLVYAQMLPIALLEVHFSLAVPYWKNLGVVGKNLVPTILVAGLVYLYAICFFVTYQTAAYYHTLFESGIGYAISLLVQLPLVFVSLVPLAFAPVAYQ